VGGRTLQLRATRTSVPVVVIRTVLCEYSDLGGWGERPVWRVIEFCFARNGAAFALSYAVSVNNGSGSNCALTFKFR
jgi:hypothetical protein